MFTWALKPNKMPQHRLIRWRNVASLTFFVCISFVMAHKSRYLNPANQKIVMWNTNRPRRLYFTIFFNFFFHIFPFFQLIVFSITCFQQRISLFSCIVTWHLLGHAIKSVTCFDLQVWRSTRPMTSFCILIAYINTEGIIFNVKITRWD